MQQFPLAYFITWTTYGSWLPGDTRGWRKWDAGDQQPRPQLEAWCRGQMKEPPCVLTPSQRHQVEAVCQRHAELRKWTLHAISARSNHVHLAVTASKDPKIVRDQFKANATRVLREGPESIDRERVWSGGGDIEFIDREVDLELVMAYIMEAQDRKERDG